MSSRAIVLQQVSARSAIVIGIMLCVVSSASALAQPGTRAQSTNKAIGADSALMDRWIAGPTPIVLTATQRKSFESLKKEFETESKQIEKDSKMSTDRMAFMKRVPEMRVRFRDRLRRELAPAQQAALDENFAANNFRREPHG